MPTPRRFLAWTFVLSIALLIAACFVLLFAYLYRGHLPRLAALTSVSTPLGQAVVVAAVGSGLALIAVLILSATRGPLEFSALGIKVRGPSGPLLLWILACLAVSAVLLAALGKASPANLGSQTARPAYTVVPAPNGLPGQKATPVAFELELRDAAAEKVGKARDYFILAESHFAAKDYRPAAEGYADILKEDDRAEITLRQSLYILRGHQDLLKQVGAASIALAICLYDKREIPQALGYFHYALHVYHQLGDRLGEATVLTNLANYAREQLDDSKALQKLQRSLPCYRDLQDPHGEIGALGNIGNIYYDEGDYDKAIESYQQALAIAKRLNFPRETSSLLTHLGDTRVEKGDVERGLADEDEAASIATGVRDPLLTTQIFKDLAVAHREQGKVDTAIKELTEARKRFHALDNPDGEMDSLVALGETYLRHGMAAAAATSCQAADPIAKASGDLKAQAETLSCIGRAALRLANLPAARAALAAAYTIYTSHGVNDKRAQALKRLLDEVPPPAAPSPSAATGRPGPSS